MEDTRSLCVICLEPLYLPVRMKCFPCQSWSWTFLDFSLHDERPKTSLSIPWCGFSSFVCFFCAYFYLELNQPMEQRSPEKKCIYCPQRCTLSSLRLQDALEWDWSIFTTSLSFPTTSLDMKSIKSMECRFCQEYDSPSLSFSIITESFSIMEHLLHHCPWIASSCSCGQWLLRGEMETHQKSCTSFFHCSDCRQYVLKTQEQNHMTKQHQKQQCRACHHFFLTAEYLHHYLFQCPGRYIHCPTCDQTILMSHLTSHSCLP